MSSEKIDEAVQATAFVAAACRAEESRQPRPRLVDPLAQRFVDASRADLAGATSRAGARQALVAAGRAEVVARTLLIDELLLTALGAVGSGTPPVVVNIGAGFCTRPYRLDLSGCRLVLEVDAVGVIALKDRLLAGVEASCPVRRVAVDLRDSAALGQVLGSDDLSSSPVVVVTEGVLVYLPEPALRGLAATLAAADRVEWWLADLVSTESAEGMNVVAAQAGAGLRLHGLESLAPIEEAGWATVSYRPLPTVRAPVGVGARWAGPGRHPAAASRRIVDGVVALRRTARVRS